MGRFNILKMVILYKFIYGVDAILPKLQKQEGGPKIQMEIQSTWNKPKKKILKLEEHTVGGLALSDFKTSYELQ